jgi:hypothetical protein
MIKKNIMLDNLDDLNYHQLKALENIKAPKIKIAEFYNQRVRGKRFSEGEFVWKVIYRLDLKTTNLANGQLTEKGHIRLLGLLLEMPTSMKYWKDKYILELLTESISKVLPKCLG